MFEKILAYAILRHVGFIEYEAYGKIIDDLFLQDESNTLLLELEYCSRDGQKSLSTLNQYMCDSNISFNYEKFGKILLEILEGIYESDKMDIREYGEKAYKVWAFLPSLIDRKEPFWTLSYADDCLSYGDEVQTRELYERTFKFYKKELEIDY